MAIATAAGVGLALLDAVAVSLLPALVDRFQGSTGGWLGNTSASTIAVVVGALFVIKSVAGAALVFWQSSFLAQDESERTIRFFEHLVQRPFGTTSDTSTGEFLRDLHVSMPMLYRVSSFGLVLLLVDAIALVALAIVVMAQAPILGVVLFLLVIAAGKVYSSLIRHRAANLGQRMQVENADVLVQITEGFGALKTAKAFAVERSLVGRFRRARDTFKIVTRDYMIYPQLSRFYLEVVLVVVLGVCFGVSYAVEGRASVISTASLLAGVAARAMPTIARVLVSITYVRVAAPTVRHLATELAELDANELARIEDDPVQRIDEPASTDAPPDDVIALDRVSFRYPRAASDALTEVSLEVRAGEMVAILGASGTGKTTLVDVLVGLLAPDSGVVLAPRAARIGYVAQETFVWDDGVLFNVALGRPSLSGDDELDVWLALEAAHLAEWVRTLPSPLETPLGERGSRMSGGQRQRLGIARALYGRPTFVILDEPTSALDTVTSRSILETLTELKESVGIVIVTHDVTVLDYADRHVELGT